MYYLPKIYRPFLELDGFVIWNLYKPTNSYYFFYKRNVNGTILRVFVYLFALEDCGGIEYVLDDPRKKNQEIQDIVKDYEKTLNDILTKRERVTRWLKPL